MSPNPPEHVGGGGNAKYAVVGVLLLLVGGVGIYLLTRKPTEVTRPPPPVVAHDAGTTVVGPTLAAPIELPPEEVDAGPPPDAGPPRVRWVTRYVGGTCNGTIPDMARVQATARANYGGLRACYEHELRANPQLRGALSARLMINTQGHVDDVAVTTAMNSRPLTTCIKRTLQSVPFPPSRGGCAIAEVRFNFAPQGE